MTKEQALPIIAKAAADCERATGFPAEVTFGQCWVESRYLNNAFGNNAFGIKYVFGRHSDCQLLRTTEWFTDAELDRWLKQEIRFPAGFQPAPGQKREVLEVLSGPDARGRKLYRVRDWFARYPTLADGLSDYVRLLQNGRYLQAWEQYRKDRDWKKLLLGIEKAGYSTAPNYAAKIIAAVTQEALAAIEKARQAA